MSTNPTNNPTQPSNPTNPPSTDPTLNPPSNQANLAETKEPNEKNEKNEKNAVPAEIANLVEVNLQPNVYHLTVVYQTEEIHKVFGKNEEEARHAFECGDGILIDSNINNDMEIESIELVEDNSNTNIDVDFEAARTNILEIASQEFKELFDEMLEYLSDCNGFNEDFGLTRQGFSMGSLDENGHADGEFFTEYPLDPSLLSSQSTFHIFEDDDEWKELFQRYEIIEGRIQRLGEIYEDTSDAMGALWKNM